MTKRVLLIIVVALLAVLALGCVDMLGLFGFADRGVVRIYLVNESSTHHLSPNPGLCPSGLETQPHFFLPTQPVLAPGESVSYTTFQLAGPSGFCCRAADNFMIGLCGWKFGTDPANLASCTQKYGGQIGVQFRCGDTVILRWTDGGAVNGTWTSEVLSAPGNAPPTAAFMLLDTEGTCGS